MATEFANIILETPDSWGETTITNEARMETIIGDLRKLGEDWESCSIADCREFELVKTISDNAALYRMLNVRHNEYRLYKMDNEFYELLNQIFTETDSEAIAEAEAE